MRHEIVCVFDDTGRFNQGNSNFESAPGYTAYTASEIPRITGVDTIAEEQRETGQINHCNLKCTITEGGVDTIVSAIYLMMEGSSKNAGLDFAEVVRQLLGDLTAAEQRHFWTELKSKHPQQLPKDLMDPGWQAAPQCDSSWVM